jgi:hypothetical protein
MTIELTITREDAGGNEIEFDVECEFFCTKAYSGARDSLGGVRGAGAALEPDEPANCEFENAVRCDTDEYIELTDDEIERATEKAYEAQENSHY